MKRRASIFKQETISLLEPIEIYSLANLEKCNQIFQKIRHIEKYLCVFFIVSILIDLWLTSPHIFPVIFLEFYVCLLYN